MPLLQRNQCQPTLWPLVSGLCPYFNRKINVGFSVWNNGLAMNDRSPSSGYWFEQASFLKMSINYTKTLPTTQNWNSVLSCWRCFGVIYWSAALKFWLTRGLGHHKQHVNRMALDIIPPTQTKTFRSCPEYFQHYVRHAKISGILEVTSFRTNRQTRGQMESWN